MERKNMDKLLLANLPDSVIQQLRDSGGDFDVITNGPQVATRHVSNMPLPDETSDPSAIAVMFSHEKFSAEFNGVLREVQTINTVLEIIEKIVYSGGGEVIKNMGTKVLNACGLGKGPDENIGVAENAFKIAVNLVHTFDNHDSEFFGMFKVRVGIHFGPVSTAIVGDLKFANDIFGDTVNIASRMMTMAPSLQVYFTDQVRNKLYGAPGIADSKIYSCGIKHVKGKGLVAVWCYSQYPVEDLPRSTVGSSGTISKHLTVEYHGHENHLPLLKAVIATNKPAENNDTKIAAIEDVPKLGVPRVRSILKKGRHPDGLRFADKNEHGSTVKFERDYGSTVKSDRMNEESYQNSERDVESIKESIAGRLSMKDLPVAQPQSKNDVESEKPSNWKKSMHSLVSINDGGVQDGDLIRMKPDMVELEHLMDEFVHLAASKTLDAEERKQGSPPQRRNCLYNLREYISRHIVAFNTDDDTLTKMINTWSLTYKNDTIELSYRSLFGIGCILKRKGFAPTNAEADELRQKPPNNTPSSCENNAGT
ncbi:hypothetical protein HDU76_000180 [Blyttiomyces sp. JEL0837]|nr:hypothetical protein HDU76_000180 [Blyttiomyces sp. JEL0837]